MLLVRSPHIRLLLALLLLLSALLALALFQGDLLEEFTDIRSLFFAFLSRFGIPGSLFLLYLEESGVPLPLPGDAILIYLGSQSPLPFLLTLLFVTLTVAAGSSNLYYLSSRFGPRALASPRLAAFFYLPPPRAARATAWFARYGALTLIFGRHIPGLRIPLTIVAGTLHLPYRLFLPSVFVSAFLWALLWLTLGARFAPLLTVFLTAHAWLYTLAVFLTLVLFAFSTVRALRTR